MPPKPKCSCGECSTCVARERSRQRYRNMTPEERRDLIAGRNKERVRADDRARHERRKNDPAYKAKRQARDTLNKAIRGGEIQRGPCEQEGPRCAGQVEGHHTDYTKPLDVRWLCVFHHAAEHYPEARAA